MENLSLILVHFLQNLLVGVLVGGLAFRLSNRYQDFLKFGLIGGLVVYLTRGIFILLGLKFGVNALITLTITAFIYKYIFKKDLIISLALSLFSYLIVFATEILTFQLTLDFLNISAEQMFKSTFLHLQVGMIQNLIITLWSIPCLMINQLVKLVCRREEVLLED